MNDLDECCNETRLKIIKEIKEAFCKECKNHYINDAGLCGNCRANKIIGELLYERKC